MLKSVFVLGIFSLIFCFCIAQQNPVPLGKTQVMGDELFNNYEKYKESSLKNRRFKHSDLVPLIESLDQDSNFFRQNIGKSVEGRNIQLIRWGKGKTKLFLWSQMHGNEATATAALFDMFNFLRAKDHFNPLRELLAQELTLYFVPMLNPDGAERFTRENALGIDLNRDARRLQFPEANLLKSLRDSLEPDFGFNLHDQGRHHSVGNSATPATMSFLAPAYNYGRNVNAVRERAIRVISEMVEVLDNYIPNQIGRYNDSFEPRAFGDNIQKWGTSTILIEAGGIRGDIERQFARKLNFVAILTASYSIAKGYYKTQSSNPYYKLPTNGSALKELKIKKLKLNFEGKSYLIDILMNRKEKPYNEYRDFYFEAEVDDVGDLPAYFAYDEYDWEGLEAEMGKVYPEVFENWEDIKNLNFKKLYAQSYTTVRLKTKPEHIYPKFSEVPLNVILDNAHRENSLRIDENPDLIIRQNGEVRFVLINGFVFDMEQNNPKNAIPNAIIYR